VLLALRTLHFTCLLAEDRYALLAILDSIALASENCPGWAHNLVTVLTALPIPVMADVSRLEEQDYVQMLIDGVEESWKGSLERDIHASDRPHLLHQRLGLLTVTLPSKWTKCSHTFAFPTSVIGEHCTDY
jgi:hypothetical protein